MIERCACIMCRFGVPNHCEGPRAAENAEKWRQEYTNAAAELALLLATGRYPTDEARDRFVERVRAARKGLSVETMTQTNDERARWIFDEGLKALEAAVDALNRRDAASAKTQLQRAKRAAESAIDVFATIALPDAEESMRFLVKACAQALEAVDRGDFDGALAATGVA